MTLIQIHRNQCHRANEKGSTGTALRRGCAATKGFGRFGAGIVEVGVRGMGAGAHECWQPRKAAGGGPGRHLLSP